MTYSVWNLTGTEQQQQIVLEALKKIHFPFERLQLPRIPTEIGWMDLNDGMFNINGLDSNGEKFDTITGKLDKPTEKHRAHGGVDHIRNYIFGVMHPASGRMYIDNWLVNRPDLAMATVSAEIAHDVDYFLPLNDSQREEIMKLLHPNGEDHHTWWERVDYGAEYYSLVGETFMILFTDAYSDIPFGDRSDFAHTGSPELAPAIRKIIGIERTDAKTNIYWKTKGSKIYHAKHHGKMNPHTITDISGLRPCKICKP